VKESQHDRRRNLLSPPCLIAGARGLRHGPPNDARFTCKAQLEFGEEVPTVLFKDARTKKEAEAGAAQKLLAEIGQG